MALEMMPMVIGGLAGLAAGAGGAGLLLGMRLWHSEKARIALAAKIDSLEDAKAEMERVFALSAQEALDRNGERFMQLAQEKLKQTQAASVDDLEHRRRAIDEMVKPIAKQLEMLGAAVHQIKGTDEAVREDLKNLSRETARLTGALRDPRAQGRWGEFILEGLLENSGLIRGVHYETQFSVTTGEGKQRPDAVIRMQDGFNIIVDAKAPLNEFADRMGDSGLSEEDFKNLSANLARQLRDHAKKLGQKNYWENIDSVDFTVLFLPSEHMFSCALRADPSLVDHAAKFNVIIASPTLLMSLVRVVGLSWRQASLAHNAQQISTMGADLYKRLSVFGGHVEKIGRGLSGALDSYNKAVGSFERNVLPAARRFRELQGQNDMDEMVINPVDATARALTSAEFTGGSDLDMEEDLKKPVLAAK